MSPEDLNNSQNEQTQQQPLNSTPPTPQATIDPPQTQATPIAQTTEPAKNTLAIVALILAIVSLVIPILPIVALVLGTVAVFKAKSLGGKSKGLAIAAIIISVFIIALHGALLYITKNVADKVNNELKTNSSLSSSTKSTDSKSSGDSQVSSKSVDTADTKMVVATTKSFLSKLDSKDAVSSYELFSDNYKTTTKLPFYKSTLYPVLSTQTYKNAEPVWVSKRSVGDNTVFGIVYSLDGTRDFSGNRYIILTVDSTKSKIHAVRISVAKTGGELKQEEEEFTKANHTLVYPLKDNTGLSMYTAGEITLITE